jgi:hypothetical protein
MPGVAGVTVVTTLVCFFIFARKAAGASRARHSLRPLGRKLNAKLGRIAPRECGGISTSLRGAKATKQSSLLNFRKESWIASLALAMTVIGCLKI